MAGKKVEEAGSAEPGATTGKATRTRKAADGGSAVPEAAPKQPAKTGRGGAASARPAGSKPQTDLKKDLRGFVSARPSGWSHEDWLNFLESLRERGHNVEDRDAIGLALERERLDHALSAVKGVGPARRQALVERFGNVWTARNASVEEIAEAGSIPRPLAESIKSGLS